MVINIVSIEEIENGFNKIKEKFNDPNLKESFKRYNKNVQFDYPDLNESYVMTLGDGEFKELKKGKIQRPDVLVIIDSDTFMAIQNKEMNAMHAYASGKVKFKGAMTDLIKLQKLL